MQIEFLAQVFSRSIGIVRIVLGSKELRLTSCTSRHRGNLALVSQDDKIAFHYVVEDNEAKEKQ